MRDIKTFLTIVNRCKGNFSKAESLLNITQPAISKRIASLEQKLNVRLFDKVGHKMMLTESGEVFYEYAMSIDLEWENANSKLSLLNSKDGGKLKIAVSNYISNHYLFDLMQDFKKEHANVEFEIQFLENSDDVKEALLNFQSDIGLMLEPIKWPKDLQSVDFAQDQVHVTLAKTGKMSDELQRVKLEDLQNYDYIGVISNTKLSTICQDFIEENNINPKSTTQKTSCDLIKKIVSIGAGWALLPDKCIDVNYLIKLPFLKDKKINIVAASNRKRTLPPSANLLLEMIAKR